MTLTSTADCWPPSPAKPSLPCNPCGPHSNSGGAQRHCGGNSGRNPSSPLPGVSSQRPTKLPGRTSRRSSEAIDGSCAAAGDTAPSSATESRTAKKTLARVEQRLAKVDARIVKVHDQMAAAAADYGRLGELQRDLDALTAEKDELELTWLETAEQAG